MSMHLGKGKNKAFTNPELYTTLGSNVTHIIHSSTAVFFAMKDMTMKKIDLQNLHNKSLASESVSIFLPTPGPLLHLAILPVQDNELIIAHTSKSFFYLPTNKVTVSKFIEVQIPRFTYMALLTSPGSSYPDIITVDNANIVKYSVVSNGNGYSFKPIRRFEHKMRSNITGIYAARSMFILTEKSKYHIFDNSLKPSSRYPEQPLKPDTKIVTYPNRDLFVILNDKSWTLIPENEIKAIDSPRFIEQEQAIAYAVKQPYLVSVSQHHLAIQAFVADIYEDLPLPQGARLKTPIIEPLDKFIIISQDKNVYVSRFHQEQCHVNILKSENKWSQAIDLCDAYDQNVFPMTSKKQEIYELHFESLFNAKRYKEAFESFKLSGKPPEKVIAKFNPNPDQLYSELKADIEAWKKCLTDLKDAIEAANHASDFPIPEDDNVVEAFKAIVSQGELRNTTIPTKEQVATNQWRQRTLGQIERDMNDAEEVGRVFENCFEQQHAQSNQRKLEDGRNELRFYLSGIVKEERQPTRIKLYNTIIIQCLVAAPYLMKEIIETNPPLFFDLTANAIKDNSKEAFRILCKLHHRHDDAIQGLFASQEFDMAVQYISNCGDTVQVGIKYFQQIFNAFNDQKSKPNVSKVVEMFFAPELTDDEVRSVIEFLENFKCIGFNSDISAEIQIRFLEYAIYELKKTSRSVHMKLIDLCISSLNKDNWISNRIISIANEKDEMKVRRMRLLRILEYSQEYQASDVITKISNRYLEEKLAALRRSRKFDDCIDLLASPNVDESIALNFCATVYDPDDQQASQVYTKLFFKLTQIRENPAAVRSYMISLLNKCPEQINHLTVVGSIPKSIKIKELHDFLQQSALSRLNKVRELSIRNAFLKQVLEAKKVQLEYLKGGSVHVTENLACSVCGKPIGESIFYILSDNTVAHSACKPN